jgi:hypothetical protein
VVATFHVQVTPVGQIINLALELPELSPRELVVRFTDERKYFGSETRIAEAINL